MSIGRSTENFILETTKANKIVSSQCIQTLWSGYGELLRVFVEGTEFKSVILKHIQFSDQKKHPRGWATDISHQRKLKSYQVECNWYQNHSQMVPQSSKIPKYFASHQSDNEIMIMLEDLDDSGYNLRLSNIDDQRFKSCLKWLANFHAFFLNHNIDDLWETGTYWHLKTRPDELNALSDIALKNKAVEIDRILNNCPYKTLVHGDAKLANFCFHNKKELVAAVDFQYVGSGCGMKDVAYFIGSCIDEQTIHEKETEILNLYFNELKDALSIHQPTIDSKTVLNNWRELYPFAWVDFHRFLKGWCPDHWKINSYSERLKEEVLNNL